MSRENTITVRVARAIATGANTIKALREAGFTQAQAYVGVRVLQDAGMGAKSQLYRGTPAKYRLTATLEEITERFEPRPHVVSKHSFEALQAVPFLMPPALPPGTPRLVERPW